jgi:hypothetical protein
MPIKVSKPEYCYKLNMVELLYNHNHNYYLLLLLDRSHEREMLVDRTT